MPTSSTVSMASSGHKMSLRDRDSCSPSPSLSSLSPKSSISYRSTSISPKTSIVNGNGFNGNGYSSYGYYKNGINLYGNGDVAHNGSHGQNIGNHTNGNSPSSVKHNSCILVNGGERKLSNSYLRFQRRYSKHG